MVYSGSVFALLCAISVLLVSCLVAPAASEARKSAVGRSMLVSKRIIGGQPVKKGDSPFLVSLQRKNDKNTPWHFCGASVFHGRFLLTAAHCVLGKNPQQIKAIIGTLSSGSQDNHDNHGVHTEDTEDFKERMKAEVAATLNSAKLNQQEAAQQAQEEEDNYSESDSYSDDAEYPESLSNSKRDYEYKRNTAAATEEFSIAYVAEIKKIIVHEDYNTGTGSNDVAVLVLAVEIPDRVESKVKAVSLPTAAMERDNYPAAGIECTAYGWGYSHAQVTEEEKAENVIEDWAIQVNLVVQNNSICTAFDGSYNSKSMICAGNLGEAYGGVYFGDSGGPLICEYIGTYYQAGIVSFGEGEQGAYVPSYFARVTAYEDWFKNIMLDNL